MRNANKLGQITFILTLLFSVVYLGLGIAILFLKDFMPWLNGWFKIIFGIGCILYAGIRFWRFYILWKESNEEI